MSQHRCATCLKPLEPQRQRAGEILCPACETDWLRHLPARAGTARHAPGDGSRTAPPAQPNHP